VRFVYLPFVSLVFILPPPTVVGGGVVGLIDVPLGTECCVLLSVSSI
jgi:hypothetical protein